MTVQVNYCVDPVNGSPTYDGERFVVGGGHGPKQTVAQALGLVPAGGGKKIGLASGCYVENGLAPNNAGASGNWNELIGDSDPDNRLVDADQNTPIPAAGPTIIDGSDATNGWGILLTYTLSGEKWDRWRLKRLIITGNTLVYYVGTAGFAIEIYDSVLFGNGVGAWLAITGRSGTSEPCKIIRSSICVVGNAIVFQTNYISMPDNPDLVIEDSFLQGSASPTYPGIVCLDCDTTHRTKVAIKRSTLQSFSGSSVTSQSIGCPVGEESYGAATAEYCGFLAYYPHKSPGLVPTYTAGHWWPVNNNQAPPPNVTAHRGDGVPWSPGLMFGHPWKVVGAGGPTTGDGLHGLSRTASGDAGAEPYHAKRFPGPPKVDDGVLRLPEYDASGEGGGGGLGPVMADLVNLGR